MIGTVVTRGYSNGTLTGTIGLVVTRGYSSGAPPACDYPVAADVRSGVVYANGSMTGVLELPAEADVLFGTGYGANGTEFVGSFVCPTPTPPTPSAILPFALISQVIVARVAYALGTTTDWVRPVANDDYRVTETEPLFAYVRCYGPYPIDPSSGAGFQNDGAGRWRRVVARRVRIYIYTRSGVDLVGGDEVTLQGADPAQNVTTPPVLPGHYVAEELVLNALDDWTPTFVDTDLITKPLTIGPLHMLDSADGPPERPAENEVGLVRSHLDWQVCYVQAIQREEPAPTSLPVPNLGN